MKTLTRSQLLYRDVPELDTPRFIFSDVATAADVMPGTLKAWLSRDPPIVPLGPYDRPGRGKGIPRLFTLRRVYAIAMTAELISLGFVASKAGNLAFAFTDLPFEGQDDRLVQASGPLFLVANAKHELFNFLTSPGIKLDQLIGAETIVSCAVIDCAALMARVRESLRKRGAL
jgi:hypothetical protein